MCTSKHVELIMSQTNTLLIMFIIIIKTTSLFVFFLFVLFISSMLALLFFINHTPTWKGSIIIDVFIIIKNSVGIDWTLWWQKIVRWAYRKWKNFVWIPFNFNKMFIEFCWLVGWLVIDRSNVLMCVSSVGFSFRSLYFVRDVVGKITVLNMSI